MLKCVLSPVLLQPWVSLSRLKSQQKMEVPLEKLKKEVVQVLSLRAETIFTYWYGHFSYAANSDYNPLVNEVLTFTFTSTFPPRQCVNIGIINDTLMEPMEQFVVRLNQLDIQQEDGATVSITDDDGKMMLKLRVHCRFLKSTLLSLVYTACM